MDRSIRSRRVINVVAENQQEMYKLKETLLSKRFHEKYIKIIHDGGKLFISTDILFWLRPVENKSQ